jgi:hypothetical protein
MTNTPSKRNPIRPQQMQPSTPARGASMQGERQNAKGGPAGANQGGASRGGSRIEPSHQKRAAKKSQPKKPT